MTSVLELLGFASGRKDSKSAKKKGRRIHLTYLSVPYTPQVFTPEEGGIPPAP